MKHFIPLIVAVLIFAAACGGYWYLWSQVSGMQENLATLAAQGTQAQAIEDTTRASESALANLESERQTFSAYVASDTDFVSVINLIEAAGRREKAAVTIGSVAVVDGAGGAYSDLVAVSLSAEGSFADVAAFLASLETLPFASRVENISMQASADKSWFATVKLSVLKKKS